MALVDIEGLTFTYPGATRPAVSDVSLAVEPGEFIALLGPSGSGKSTLIRALAGLVPHFHGGRFAGRVEVAGRDTRSWRPADLAGTVATVFQDPEDQVVMAVAENEVAFGLENVGTPPVEIWGRAEEALEALGALHLARRRTAELSGGELQRVCLAAALALQPKLLLLDEPTSQLDPAVAEAFLEHAAASGAAVVLSEHRIARALRLAERVLFLHEGRMHFDGSRQDALEWLAVHRPSYLPDASPGPTNGTVLARQHRDTRRSVAPSAPAVCALKEIGFSYRAGGVVLADASVMVKRGEVVALEGANGSGKTTLAKIAAGLLRPSSGSVVRPGRAGYLSQDPGRYIVCDRVLDETALAVGGDRDAARRALERVGLGWAAERHPRDLSSGERERLGLAAVAVSEPDLLVLDEPTRGVDPERKQAIADWLFAYAEQGRGVLIATHDRSLPAHRRLRIEQGAVTEIRRDDEASRFAEPAISADRSQGVAQAYVPLTSC